MNRNVYLLSKCVGFCKTIWKILLKIKKYNITFCLPPVTIGSDGQIIDAFYASLHEGVYYVAKFGCSIA